MNLYAKDNVIYKTFHLRILEYILLIQKIITSTSISETPRYLIQFDEKSKKIILVFVNHILVRIDRQYALQYYAIFMGKRPCGNAELYRK